MIRVACVGCGGIMHEHYSWLSAMEGVKIAGHCDVDKERAEDCAAKHGGQAFRDHEAMFDKVKPHAVYIGVPPYGHVGMEEAAAERGIHLFVEKPIALDKATAKRIASAVRKAKILSSVGYCYRYSDTVARARQFLKGRPISLVAGSWTGAMPDVWWWRRMEKSGGQVIEQTTHMIDLVRYLCGDVAEVYATAATGCMNNVQNYNVHDSSVAAMRLKNGASAVVTSTCVSSHRESIFLEIVTPDATVSLRNGILTLIEEGKTTEYRPTVNMFESENRAFIDAVRAGKRNGIRSTYSDGLKSFLVTAAINESIASGMPEKP